MSEKLFNVLDFGARANSLDLDTAAVQAAVDACSAAGGGKVVFPRGTYVLATVFLKDNVHIFFEDGAVILGALVTAMGKSMPKQIKCENGHILAVTKLHENIYIISEDDYNTHCAPANRQGGAK